MSTARLARAARRGGAWPVAGRMLKLLVNATKG
jgi:hypothetical protein